MRWLEGNTWPSQQEAIFLRVANLLRVLRLETISFLLRNKSCSLDSSIKQRNRRKTASCCDGHVLPSSHRIAHGRGMDLLPGIEVPQRRAVSSNHRLK